MASERHLTPLRLASDQTSGPAMRITALSTHDVRFPTSRSLDGSDAMHRRTRLLGRLRRSPHRLGPERARPDLHERARHGGLRRGIRALEPLVVGRTLEGITGDMRGFCVARVGRPAPLAGAGEGSHAPGGRSGRERRVGPVGQGRGPAALAAPLRAPSGGARGRNRLSLHRGRAVAGRGARPPAHGIRGKAQRERQILADGYPAYTTSAGWFGYDDEKVAALVQQALADGFRHVKMKVGGDLDSDARRASLIRDVLGADGVLMMDANQVWGVDEAIAAMAARRVRTVDRGSDATRRRVAAASPDDADREPPLTAIYSV